MDAPDLSDRAQDSEQRLLAHVFGERREAEPHFRLDQDQAPELLHEMPLGLRIARAKAIEVGRVKPLRFHGFPSIWKRHYSHLRHTLRQSSRTFGRPRIL